MRLPKTGEIWGWDYGDGIPEDCYFVTKSIVNNYWMIDLNTGELNDFDWINESEFKVSDAPELISILYGIEDDTA